MPDLHQPTSISTIITELIGWKFCPCCGGLCNYESAEYSEAYDDLACPHCHAILRIDVCCSNSDFLPPEALRFAQSGPGVEGAEPTGGGSRSHIVDNDYPFTCHACGYFADRVDADGVCDNCRSSGDKGTFTR